MFRSRLPFPSLACAILLALLGLRPAARGAAADFNQEVKPLLESYCFKCHANGKKKGDVTLDGFTSVDSVLKDTKLWGTMLETLKSGDMPPDEAKQPTVEERDKLMKWINLVVFATDPDRPDPGRVTLRRLNRAEYNNTIHDLVGIDFEPGTDFPTDDTGYGFDNIGDALSMPPVLFERYLAAAEKVMSTAILNDHKPRPVITTLDLLKITGGPEKGNTAASRRVDENESTATETLNLPGQYTLQIEASVPRVGSEMTKMTVKWNGADLMVPPFTGNGDQTTVTKINVTVAKPGPQTLALQVANPLKQPEKGKDGKPTGRRITLRKVTLASPLQPVQPPETQVRIFAAGRGQPSLELAARTIVNSFALRAFRRPLTAVELDRLMFIYATAVRKGGNFEQGVQIALTAVLVSPHFLFRGEMQPQPDNPQAVQPIDEWALASRLSYFLWSTMPDPELFAQAQAGTLRKNLEAQVRRMLASPKASELVDNFAGQWLQIRNVTSAAPDVKEFPEWDKQMAAAAERETSLLFQNIMNEDRPVTDVIGADYTFVNEKLARLYGIDGVEGDAFVKVKLPPGRPGGVLGQASFLTITSNPTRTSPVKRGKYVLENLLGTPPPPPPPDVPDLDKPGGAELHGSLRQRLERHRQDPACAGCHARMDPIGFGLENFNPIGAWRDNESGAALDPSGTLVSGEKFKGPVDLRDLLLSKKRPDFLRCVSEKMLTYALGRGLEFYDKPAVEKIAGGLDKDGAKFSALVLGIVKSTPFQMRRGEGDHRKFAEPPPSVAKAPVEMKQASLSK